MSVIDFTLAKKLKDFFTRNFGVEPRMKSDNNGYLLVAAMIGSRTWVSIWFDGSKNFCLMGNYQIKTHELTKLIGEMEKFFGITDLNAGHCGHDLYALPMAIEKAAAINQEGIDRIKRETKELLR